MDVLLWLQRAKTFCCFNYFWAIRMKQMDNLCDLDCIFVGLQSTLNPNIERTTGVIDMIVSAFERYDVTLSNDNKIKIEKHLEGSKIQ